MVIRVVVIDDEVLCVELLVKMLETAGGIQVVGTANSVHSGIETINRTMPDVVFLDINMQGESGFDVLNLTDRTFEVIIASGYDYALTAFKAHALDYLLKPIDLDDLLQSIEKVKKKLLQNAGNPKDQGDAPAIIAVPCNGDIKVIAVGDIVRCEGFVTYSQIHLKNGEMIATSKTLVELEKILFDHNFFRIHKSHLVNLNFVKGFVRGNAPYLTMIDQSHLKVSRRNKEQLFTRLTMAPDH